MHRAIMACLSVCHSVQCLRPFTHFRLTDLDETWRLGPTLAQTRCFEVSATGGDLKFDGRGARTKSPTGLSVCWFACSAELLATLIITLRVGLFVCWLPRLR